MSKNRNKRDRYQIDKPIKREASVSELAEWNTGYSDPELQDAALNIAPSKGSQKAKRDKLKYGIRIGNGTDDAGKQLYAITKADKSRGSFIEPTSSRSSIQPGGYTRAINHPSRVANELSPYGDSRRIPEPQPTRKARTVK